MVSFKVLFVNYYKAIPTPNIWILVDKSILDVLVVSVESQQVTLRFMFGNDVHFFNFVHGNVLYRSRKELWLSLVTLRDI